MIKYEVIKLAETQVNYLHYTFFIDRVMITLQPQRPACYQKVRLSPRADDGAFTFTDLARSLPEAVYSAKALGDKIVEAQAQQADIRDLIVSYLFRHYRSSLDDKRRILLNLKSDINTTDFFKKSTDLVCLTSFLLTSVSFLFLGLRPQQSLELHLMSLEDLLNLFPGDSDDDEDDAARAKLLALCI